MKEKIFVVVDKELIENKNDVFITKAESVERALEICAKEHYARSDLFIEHVEDRSINMSFWEQFFLGSIFNDDFKTDLNDKEIKEKLKENIKDYLAEDKHLLTELINFYFDEDKKFEELSTELKHCIALKEFQKEINTIIVKEVPPDLTK